MPRKKRSDEVLAESPASCPQRRGAVESYRDRPAPSSEVQRRVIRTPGKHLRGNLRKHAFLAAFGETGSVSLAARAAKIDRQMHYRWLKADPEYAAKFEVLRAETVQMLEDEAVRRAWEGWLEPVFYRGQVCGYSPRYSDSMLMFLLRSWRSDRYRDRTEVSGPCGCPTDANTRVITLAQVLTLEELRAIRARIDAHTLES